MSGRMVDLGGWVAGQGGCIMTAKELFSLSRESLVCCVRAGSAFAHSQQRLVSALPVLHVDSYLPLCVSHTQKTHLIEKTL